jgi:peptidoglycan/xylan/chitin deacetylase (PgdA/CDA1 family)
MQLIETLRERPDLWDLFTRKEEYEDGIRDKYDRFPYFLSRERSILEPVVSAFLYEKGFHPSYPEGKRFAVCLSHDIDFLYEAPETKLIKAIQSFVARDMRQSWSHLRQMPATRIPFWNFDAITSLEERYGARSTFYFLAQDKSILQKEGDGSDFSYQIDDVKLEMRELDAGGWGIGLHGGLDCHTGMDQLRQEKELLERTLGKRIIGYRGHFLKFKVPDTWKNLESAGFEYDSTLYYADCVGFRNGMCHPFHPYDLNTAESIDILELPMAVMDTSLFEYMRLDEVQAWEMTRSLLDKTRKLGGAVSVLWHNSSMFGERLKFYEKLLKYCNENEAWLTSAEQLNDHWKERYQI